ncbi:hypothetical protein DNTS_020912 [Danionella cerebrum]|uniref:Uncharacterized protein n=1 Tax=Danionella cerebrum TaxID=2873325 RepID=A0A553QIL4_9TELE|nr:hypothetical protein DNTS_000013 [Danionella translucida]TRZ00279.1 hypothetical protein DNTS_020912 [Danionella translucida]
MTFTHWFARNGTMILQGIFHHVSKEGVHRWCLPIHQSCRKALRTERNIQHSLFNSCKP